MVQNTTCTYRRLGWWREVNDWWLFIRVDDGTCILDCGDIGCLSGSFSGFWVVSKGHM